VPFSADSLAGDTIVKVGDENILESKDGKTINFDCLKTKKRPLKLTFFRPGPNTYEGKNYKQFVMRTLPYSVIKYENSMDESEESNDNNSNVVDLNMSSADQPICLLDTSDEEDSDDEEKKDYGNRNC
jgi:hypothetical protein